MTRVLAVRLDNDGDVLLTGPALRAVAASADHVTLLHGPRGSQAAALLPGVDERVEYTAAWIDPDPPPVTAASTEPLLARIRAGGYDEAIVWTSFHQSPLPAALLLRLAAVPRVSAISEDYPGSLLDVRHRVAGDVHEVERALSLAAAAGYRLPARDGGALDLRRPLPATPGLPDRYVVVHPGASVPARAWAPAHHERLVRLLADAGWAVLVTGGAAEAGLCEQVAGVHGRCLAGRTSLAELAAVLEGADAAVVGNTGPAHLAAAVGTPVVSLFAPTVPPQRWRPWGVPHVLLGQHAIGCAGCRARACPLPGHPCLDDVTPAAVLDALRALLADRDRAGEPSVVAAR